MRERLDKRKGWLIAALACFALAAFFRFALVGYATLALLLAAAGVVTVLYLLLPKGLRIALTAALCLGAAIFLAAEIHLFRP